MCMRKAFGRLCQSRGPATENVLSPSGVEGDIGTWNKCFSEDERGE